MDSAGGLRLFDHKKSENHSYSYLEVEILELDGGDSCRDCELPESCHCSQVCRQSPEGAVFDFSPVSIDIFPYQ